MANLVRLIATNKSCITRWENEIAGYLQNDVVDNARLIAICSGLTVKVRTFHEALANARENDVDVETIDNAEQCVDKCETLLARAQMLIVKTPPVQAEPPAPPMQALSLTTAKLPKIEFEPFYGDIAMFEQFWSLFKACIDVNDSLSDAAKLTYLISLLKGDASSVVAGMNVTPKNYELAKTLLTSRYGQPQKVIHTLFQKLLNIDHCSSDFKHLRTFYDTLLMNKRSLENQGVNIDEHSVLLTSQILSKLPQHVRAKCVSSFGGGDWLVSRMMTTLEKYIVCGEACELSVSTSSDCVKFSPLNSTFSSLTTSHRGPHDKPQQKPPYAGPHCAFCDTNLHSSGACTKYKTLDERYKIIMKHKLCLLCFRPSHFKSECRSDYKCIHCSGRHNSAMCAKKLSGGAAKGTGSTRPNFQEKPRNHTHAANLAASQPSPQIMTDVHVASSSSSAPEPEVNSSLVCGAATSQNSVLLQQATARVSDTSRRKFVNVNILFDTGSHLSYITQRVADSMCIDQSDKRGLNVSTFMSAGPAHTECAFVNVLLHSTARSHSFSAFVVPKICAMSPVCFTLPPAFQELDVAFVPDGHSDLQVDVLIGMDWYWSFMTNEIVHSVEGYSAMRSVFGWTISGCCKSRGTDAQSLATNTLLVTGKVANDSLENHIEQIFNHDFSFLGGSCNDNEMACFLENIEFSSDIQRYVSRLPWKKNVHIDSHLQLSMKRLYCLHSKLSKQPDTLAEYDSQIKQQLNDEIIEIAPDNATGTVTHYMPHHCVIRSDHATTKMRVVYDGSAKRSARDPSLNECLLVGPKLIPLLMPLVLSFRCFRYGVIADIQKAFLMIEIADEDRDALRFLWFKNPDDVSDGVVHYRFCRLPFGLISSPAVLNTVLNHHLTVHNVAAKTSFYVDDFVSGFNDSDSGSTLCSKVHDVLSLANFKLHKFVTNCEEVQVQFGQSLSPGFKVKVLGVPWSPQSDVLFVDLTKLEVPTTPSTKRGLLKANGEIFDPLGIVSPFTIGLRMILQKAWSLHLDWDVPLPDSLLAKVSVYLNALAELKNFSLPRVMCTSDSTVTLYGFCDASAQAIACVFYVVSTSDTGSSNVTFCCAKSRVAPLKGKFTIPRLELLACLLLANMYSTFQSSLPPHKCQFFSDSLCALYWIKNEHKCWKQYVQSRVDVVRSHTSKSSWYFTPGAINPADIATRGICDLDEFAYWIRGPEFLTTQIAPTQPEYFSEQVVLEEVVTLNVDLQTPPLSNPLPTLDIGRFGTYKKLLYTVSRVLCWSKRLHCSQYLNLLDVAEVQLCRSIQFLSCQRLFDDIVTDRRLKLTWQLQLYLRDGLIMVRTRIPGGSQQGSSLIFLPKKSHFTTLIIQHHHKKVCHGGLALTLSSVRQLFWIECGRQAVKGVLNKCVFCKHVRGRPYDYPLPPCLPNFRTEGSVFHTVGVDYAGPFLISGGKSYILLFTCAVSRALHVEVTADLSTYQFILALQRFVSRRGHPKVFVSDNAQTFNAASIYLESVRSDTSCARFVADNRIRWLFNCSRAAWWGGWFERVIGLIKDLLRKHAPKRATLSYTEFSSLLCYVEFVLNGRPLSFVSSDDVETVITPAHLLGTSINNVGHDHNLSVLFADKAAFLKKFWGAFTGQYLAGLRERYSEQCNNYESCARVGDVCLMHQPNTQQWHWPLVKIVEIVLSNDGLPRKAKVLTSKRTIVERALCHLVPLEARPDHA